MRAISLLLAVAALCASSLSASPAAADGGALGQPDKPGSASLGTEQARLRGLRESVVQAAESVQAAAAATLAPVDSGGDNPLKPPSSPVLHRVYDPLTGLTCDLVSECLACAVTERDATYCRETGFRQELDCPRPNEEDAEPADTQRETRYRACVPPERVAPAVAVFKFEMAMGACLAVAFYLLLKERRNHMSSFDLRKEPRQTRTLLGSTASKDSD